MPWIGLLLAMDQPLGLATAGVALVDLVAAAQGGANQLRRKHAGHLVPPEPESWREVEACSGGVTPRMV